MVTEDLGTFLADFGTSVTVGDASFLAIFNEPDQLVGDYAVSTEYSIQAKTSDVAALKFGDAVAINAETYSVRKNMKQDDGAMSLVTLSKEDPPPEEEPEP